MSDRPVVHSTTAAASETLDSALLHVSMGAEGSSQAASFWGLLSVCVTLDDPSRRTRAASLGPGTLSIIYPKHSTAAGH
jgi:hypothetical protein